MKSHKTICPYLTWWSLLVFILAYFSPLNNGQDPVSCFYDPQLGKICTFLFVKTKQKTLHNHTILCTFKKRKRVEPCFAPCLVSTCCSSDICPYPQTEIYLILCTGCIVLDHVGMVVMTYLILYEKTFRSCPTFPGYTQHHSDHLVQAFLWHGFLGVHDWCYSSFSFQLRRHCLLGGALLTTIDRVHSLCYIFHGSLDIPHRCTT